MTIRSFTAPLPTDKSSGVTNLIDNCFNPSLYVPTRSTGSIVRFPAALPGPTIDERWSLVNLTVTGYLRTIIGNQSPGGTTAFGKFGTMHAALDPFHDVSSTQNHLGGGAPWDFPIQNIPPDQSLAVTLWDPDVDPLPPLYAYTQANPPSDLSYTLPVSGVIAPPNPIPLIPGQQPGIILWSTPQLFGLSSGGVPNYCGIMMISGTYNIDYDDGT